MDVDREQGTVSHHPGWPGPPPGARPVPLPPGLHPPQPPQVTYLLPILVLSYSKLQAVPHSSPATTPLSVSTPPYRQNGGSGDTSRPPLSPQQVTEESTKKYLMLLYLRLVPQCHTQKERAGWVLMDRF